jgi:hypothetical protein
MTEESLLETLPTEPKSFLEELVGDNKKFRDAEALARGKYEADRFIELKNKQFDDLKEDYLKLLEESKTRATLEELIDRNDKMLQPPTDHTKVLERKDQPTYKLEDIKNLARQTYAEEETARQQQSNFNTVKAKLKEQFGDNYAPTVRERISALGLSEADFNDWARKSPTAVLNALGTPARSQDDTSPPRNSRTFSPVTEKKRTWSYYQEMRKSNPKLYADPEIMNQMLSDAEALGTAFEDGDFHTR